MGWTERDRRTGAWRRDGLGSLVGTVALGALLAPTALAGQGLEFGLGFSRIRNPPADLFDSSCPASHSWSSDGRASLRFSRAVALEGTVSYNWANGDQCVDDPVLVPPTGPFESTTRATPGGFPFVTTDLRLGIEPSNPSGSMWLKAFGGYGRMWSKDIGYWLAGGGLVFGGQLQTVLELEWNWFNVPFDETTRQFMDGVEVGTSQRSGATSHNTFRVRGGIRWRP